MEKFLLSCYFFVYFFGWTTLLRCPTLIKVKPPHNYYPLGHFDESFDSCALTLETKRHLLELKDTILEKYPFLDLSVSLEKQPFLDKDSALLFQKYIDLNKKLSKTLCKTLSLINQIIETSAEDDIYLYCIQVGVELAKKFTLFNVPLQSQNSSIYLTRTWEMYCKGNYFDPKLIFRSNFFYCKSISKSNLQHFFQSHPQLKIIIFVKDFFSVSDDKEYLYLIIDEIASIRKLSEKPSPEPQIDDVSSDASSNVSSLCVIS